jgi:DNA-directed RNA polymerase subunit RPC12/RpoP
MPMLSVKCAKCSKMIPTGIEMTFKSATYTTLTVECPNCENLQTWTLDDVDRSVFGAEKR